MLRAAAAAAAAAACCQWTASMMRGDVVYWFTKRLLWTWRAN